MQRFWVPLDNSPPGTPAEINFDAQASSLTDSYIDLHMHGFWVTPRQGPDALAYQQIQAPGLHDAHVVGSPELPVYRFRLGIATGSGQAQLAGAQVLSTATFANVLPWPHPVPALPDSANTPEHFVRDAAVYNSPLDFPAGPAQQVSEAIHLTGTLDGALCEVHPFRWNASGTLTVDAQARYAFSHAGPQPLPAEAGSAMAARGALASMLNAPVVQPWITWNTSRYDGYFLFLYPEADSAEIAPLVIQKQKRGFAVTTIPITPGGWPSGNVREAIEGWYATTPRKADHYCLLVGDVDVIPLAQSPHQVAPVDGSIPTDDLYGDADGNGIDDLGKEVYVGRLSILDAADLAAQVTRILAYEDHPSPVENYGTVGLVAHGGNGVDTWFGDCQEVVRTSTYTDVAPVFDTVYGTSPTATNSDIDLLAKGDGIVCYQGHGSDVGWVDWNGLALVVKDSYELGDIAALANHPVNPVIWSFACLTGYLQTSTCFIEGWMRQGTDGAVAAYGSTMASYINENVVLDQSLFQAVFDLGITTHALAIDYAEKACTVADWEFNEWMYLLLGDPSMQIRRESVDGPGIPHWTVALPTSVPPACVGCPMIEIGVHAALGQPVGGLRVALWKPGPGAGPAASRAASLSQARASEVLMNAYTGPDGIARFTLPPLTAGTLYVTTWDDRANVREDSIRVATNQLAVEPNTHASALRLSALPSVTARATRLAFGGTVRTPGLLTLSDPAGRLVRGIRVAGGADGVTWDGRDAAGRTVPAGIYFATLESEGLRSSTRVIVTR